jgi:hypothetical protein
MTKQSTTFPEGFITFASRTQGGADPNPVFTIGKNGRYGYLNAALVALMGGPSNVQPAIDITKRQVGFSPCTPNEGIRLIPHTNQRHRTIYLPTVIQRLLNGQKLRAENFVETQPGLFISDFTLE